MGLGGPEKFRNLRMRRKQNTPQEIVSQPQPDPISIEVQIDPPQPKKETITDKLLKELRQLREITGGPGAADELIVEEDYPLLMETAPVVVRCFRNNAIANHLYEEKLIGLKSKYGPAIGFMTDDERNFVFWGNEVGMGEEAVRLIESQYEKRINDMNKSGVGARFK
jgi:hypothetical protein